MDRQKVYRPDKTKYPEDLKKYIVRDGFHPTHMEVLSAKKLRAAEGLPFYDAIEGLFLNSWHTVLEFEDGKDCSVVYFPTGVVSGFSSKFEIMWNGSVQTIVRYDTLDQVIDKIRELRDTNGEA